MVAYFIKYYEKRKIKKKWQYLTAAV